MAQSLVTGITTPGATVTVYWYGTTTKPTINVSDGGSAASNPITANTNDGSYSFWVSDGHYKIVNGSTSGDVDLHVKQGSQIGKPSVYDIATEPFLGSTETNLGTMLEKLLYGTLSMSGGTLTGPITTTSTTDSTTTATGSIITAGGIGLAKSLFAGEDLNIVTANGATFELGYVSEEITLSTSGTTTDSTTNLLTSNALILGVLARVTTTITTATDWKIGDASTAARFSAANSTLVAGTTSVGLDHWKGAVASDAAGPTQTSSAKVRITTTGTPGAGKIRVTVFHLKFIPPTS